MLAPMILLFPLLVANIAAAEEIVIDPWVIPISNEPYATRFAAAGDVISFHYSGNHNVYVSAQVNNSTCDTSNAEIVGATGDGSANYTFSATTPSVTFFCGYTTHCDLGQQLEFQVFPTRDDFPPTNSPTNFPTLSPSNVFSAVPSVVPTVQITATPFVPLFNTTFAPTSASATRSSTMSFLPVGFVLLASCTGLIFA